MGVLAILSPAKRLDYERALPPLAALSGVSAPRFADETALLATCMRALNAEQVETMMAVSERIATRVVEQFRAFTLSDNKSCDAFDNGSDNISRAAMYAFAGDTYIGLNAYAFDEKSATCAQSKLRILSGLYGLLRPLDAIQPYRLEMGLRFSNAVPSEDFLGATKPSEWWRDKVTSALKRDMEDNNATALINLASKEYVAAIDTDALGVPVVDVVFAEKRDGVMRRLGMAEKRQRGALARFIVERDVTDLDQLKQFDESGFRFEAQISSPSSSASSNLTLRFERQK